MEFMILVQQLSALPKMKDYTLLCLPMKGFDKALIYIYRMVLLIRESN